MNVRTIGIDNFHSIIFANYNSFLGSNSNNSDKNLKDHYRDERITALITTGFTLR